ncbi:uncharacterized protein LOC129952247 isoform X2 [Eupeodes corollae]|uniref:uncharacterized protein LOC129952247 isoform X2 n=1 Tax=Eupeodes corollae TaxID=290404 RepID=UPI00249193D1|nr:uncharacterized protein LOC129952247 isoform X2 [Eupeodes corollae]
MHISKLSAFPILCVVLILNINLCNAATLPANGNDTMETTALAKTSAIIDVFEDIRWFFGRLGIFCELVEQMLPPEKRDADQNQLSFNLQTGFRHFLLGVREISKSIVAVLSNKDVQEYQQLSRATDYAQEAVKTVGEFFRNLRLLVGKVFETYNYYVPEVVLTKCVGSYLHETYAHRPMYEYPILMINDIIEAFQTPINQQIEGNGIAGSDRKMGSGREVDFTKNVEQNEILDDDLYVFHNTPVSPTPELANRFEIANPENNSSKVEDEKVGAVALLKVASWKKCFKIYATETIFRKLEFYFLERKE